MLQLTHLPLVIKRLFVIFLLPVFLIAFVPPAGAQGTATELQSLAVELWPDYDRPSMLVLMTGTLPAGTTLPVPVTIPLPADAEINAVASVEEGGVLMSNPDYTIENGLLTLTSPTNRFHVEYYSPYEVDGNEHSYSFEWVSDLTIDQLTTVVQQPLAAVDFSVTPAATNSVANRGDDLTYHSLPPRTVAAGEPFTVEVRYTVDAPVLSAPAQSPASPIPATATNPSAPATDGFDPLWLLIGAGVLALVGGAFFLGRYQSRAGSRARKPQPARPAKTAARPPAAPTQPKQTGATRFCHNCGHRAQPTDAFCRKCGRALKTD